MDIEDDSPRSSEWFWLPAMADTRCAGWPKPDTPEAKAVDNNIRPLVQALKFVDSYREEWDQLESQHGRETVLEALRAYRSGGARWPDIQCQLHNLTVTCDGIGFGPVDPHDLDDFGSPPRADAVVDTLWFLRNGSIRVRGAMDWSQVESTLANRGCLPVILDLRWPDSDLHNAIRMLRRSYAIERPTIRPKGRRPWDDGNHQGLREAFRARAQQETHSLPLWQIARDVCQQRLAEGGKKAATELIRRLITDTDPFVDDMKNRHADARACLIPRPPVSHLPPEAAGG